MTIHTAYSIIENNFDKLNSSLVRCFVILLSLVLVSLSLQTNASACQFRIEREPRSATQYALTLRVNGGCQLAEINVFLVDVPAVWEIELGLAENGAKLQSERHGSAVDLTVVGRDGATLAEGTLAVLHGAGSGGILQLDQMPEPRIVGAVARGTDGHSWSQAVDLSPENRSSKTQHSLIASQPAYEEQSARAQSVPVITKALCGDTIPPGWATTSITGYCQLGPGLTSTGRIIEELTAFPAGATLDICGQDPPAGWVPIKVKPQYCAQLASLFFIGYTIERVDTLTSAVPLVICGGVAPNGWVTTQVSSAYCAVLGNTTFVGSKIERIDSLANGSTVSMCGGTPPPGWVSVAVSTKYCAQINNQTSFIGTTIMRVDGSRAGTTVSICGGSAPVDWVTTAIKSQYCAAIGNLSYIGRTIERIDTLPTGSTVQICGDPIPKGWMATQLQHPCAELDFVVYDGVSIKKE